MDRHLAQLNIATLRHPIDDPRIADFVDALPLVNGAGEQTPGYVWRLQSDTGNATDIRVFDDPLVIVNLTVWESLEALKAFAYRGVHRDFFKRRAEWFVPGSSRTALWWLPARPASDDRRCQATPGFHRRVRPSRRTRSRWVSNSAALVIEAAANDDERVQRMLQQLDDHRSRSPTMTALVADLDDEPVACGAYRRTDEHTAEIKRMYVAQPARGLRSARRSSPSSTAAAASNGIDRLLLETGPRQGSSLALYERYGFRRCACWSERRRSRPGPSAWRRR